MKRALDDLEIYREAMDFGERVWEIVICWDFFARDTVGKQFVRAVDSIAANLAEGHGRFHYKENRTFCYYSRGSAEESQTWIEKAVRRNLMDRELGTLLYGQIEAFKKRLNAYINSIGDRPDAPRTREEEPEHPLPTSDQ